MSLWRDSSAVPAADQATVPQEIPNPGNLRNRKPALLRSSDEDLLLDLVADQREWMTRLLIELMTAPSTPGHEHHAQRIVHRVLTELQLDVTTVGQLVPEPGTSDGPKSDRHNLIGSWHPTEVRGRSLTLSGHVDVLPPPTPALWSAPPFEPRLEHDAIIGWGGLKAGLVAMLGTLRTMRQAGIEPTGLLRIQSVIDEETSGAGAAAALATYPRPDGAVVAGCAGNTIAIAQVGVIWIEIRVEFPPRHAAGNRADASALHKVLQLTAAVEETIAQLGATPPAAYRGVENPLGFNLGAIGGGSIPSLTLGDCTVLCRIGMFPERNADDVLKIISTRVHESASLDPLLREYPPQVRMAGFHAQGYQLDREDPLVQVAVTAHRRVGVEPALIASTTATDTRNFVHGGTPAICVGPPIGNLHSTDERVAIPDLVLAAQKIGSIISQWCGIRVSNPPDNSTPIPPC